MAMPLDRLSNISPKYKPFYLPTFLEKQKYIEQLAAITLESFYDGTGGNEKCKAIGQKIFNYYKKHAYGETVIGVEATDIILDEIATSKKPSEFHLQFFVAHAWDGIGDENWQWKYDVNVAANHHHWQRPIPRK